MLTACVRTPRSRAVHVVSRSKGIEDEDGKGGLHAGPTGWNGATGAVGLE
jgi:hypothetical protein